MPYATMADVKRANKAAGHYWFSKDTLQAFQARVESPLIEGKYWIESTDDGTGREYKIAQVNERGDVGYLHLDYRVLRWPSKRGAMEHLNSMLAGQP